MQPDSKLVDRLSSLDVSKLCQSQATNDNTKQEGSSNEANAPFFFTVEVHLDEKVVNAFILFPVNLANALLGTVVKLVGFLMLDAPVTVSTHAGVYWLLFEVSKGLDEEGCSHVAKSIHQEGDLLDPTKTTNQVKSLVHNDSGVRDCCLRPLKNWTLRGH